MSDFIGLRHDIATAKAIIAVAESRLDKCEREIAEMRIEKDSPAWKPEDLIGRLVYAWNSEMDETVVDILEEYIDDESRSCRLSGHGWYNNIRPLTEAEALALVHQPKPKTRYDWSKAPEWAQWAATDKNGVTHFYEIAPYLEDDFDEWLTQYKYKRSPEPCILDHSGDWRDSLERRPS